MKENGIFMIIILLAVSFNCENTHPKKSFLQVKLQNTSNSTSDSGNNTNSTETAAEICSQAKEYQGLMVEVDQNMQELADAFEDHLKDVKEFQNSSTEVVDKYHWQEHAEDLIDYYINKTGAMMNVYEDLNNTVVEIKNTYCNMKVVVTVNTTPPVNNTKTTPVVNNTNTTAPVNNTKTTTAVNTTNTTTPPVLNTTTSDVNNTNTTTPAANKTVDQSTSVNTNVTDGTTLKPTSDAAPAVSVTSSTDTSKTVGTDTDTMTIFVQRLQQVATEYGLPENYVQIKLKKLRTDLRIKKKLHRLK